MHLVVLNFRADRQSNANGVFRLIAISLTVMLGAAVNTSAAAHSPAAVVESGALTAEQAKLDVRVLKRALQTLHPALTKYLTQAESDAAFEKFEARGLAARTATEMYLAGTELDASIRCGHT